MLRTDVPLFTILSLSAFLRGEVVGQLVKGKFTFDPEDYFEWTGGAGQNGFADVVKVEESGDGFTFIAFKKR